MFTLDQVVPWGRSFGEYCRMFDLTDDELKSSIVGCGDGPAAFNAGVTRLGGRAVSCDPLYRFTADEIRDRIQETCIEVLRQTRSNADQFVWDLQTSGISSVEQLLDVRMQAMTEFLADFDDGKAAGRYVDASLPALPFQDGEFEFALSSHFLFLYSAHFDKAFHLAAVREMCRVAREVRIFPLIALDGRPSLFVNACVAEAREGGLDARIVRVPYEFQRGARQMLRIRR